MTFRIQIGPLIKELWVFYVFAKLQIGNHIGLMDSWKTKSKNALYYQKNQTRELFGDFKVGVLFRVILNLTRPSLWY